MKTWFLRMKENASVVDRALKEQLPQTEIPDSLHAGIMRAVRHAAHAPEERAVLWPRWVAASGFACAVVTVIITMNHLSAKVPAQKPQPEAMAVAQADLVFDLSGNFVHEAPAAAISPLTDEMNKMDHDLQRTEKFLIASLPGGGGEME